MSEILDRGRAAADKIGDLLGPIVSRFPEDQQPLVLAQLERNAARRYREWAEAANDEAETHGLLACATREEEVAATVELSAGSADDVTAMLTAHLPELREAYDSVFGGKNRLEQMAVQAAAERLGASVWKQLARTEWGKPRAVELKRCANLEEQSAAYLEELLGGD